MVLKIINCIFLLKKALNSKNAIPISLFEPLCMCKVQNNEVVRAATFITEQEIEDCKLWEKVDE